MILKVSMHKLDIKKISCVLEEVLMLIYALVFDCPIASADNTAWLFYAALNLFKEIFSMEIAHCEAFFVMHDRSRIEIFRSVTPSVHFLAVVL